VTVERGQAASVFSTHDMTVVTLADGETVHNAFEDRDFGP